MTKNTSVKAAPRRRRIVSLEKKKARAGWLFVLPFAIGLVLIYLPIIIDSIWYSFSEIKMIEGGGNSILWVGFDNYRTAIGTSDFMKTLTSGLQSLFFDIPAIVIFSLFIAVLLNKKMFGRAAFRAIFFIPVILATGLIAEIDQSNAMQQSMSSGEGIDDGSGASGVEEIVSVADLSWLFNNMQIGTGLMEYVTGVVNNVYDIINRSGVQMLIFLAGLQSISPAIYESCSIDGATGWETFWKITFPMISPMILVNTVYTVIDSFTSQSNSVMTYIDDVYTEGNYVLATSMSWIYFLIVIAIIALVAALLSTYIFYQKRDS